MNEKDNKKLLHESSCTLLPINNLYVSTQNALVSYHLTPVSIAILKCSITIHSVICNIRVSFLSLYAFIRQKSKMNMTKVL